MRCKAGMFSRNQVKVPLLLHFDGTSGSTTYTDSSGTSKTVVGSGGGEEISTTQSKFGGSSLSVGTGYVYTADDPSLRFSDNDFTVELWYYQTDETPGVLAAQWGYAWFIATTVVFVNGNAIIEYAQPSLNEWHHVALTRSGSWMRLFIDGVSQGDYEIGTGGIDASTAFIGIGRDEYGNPALTGYIDEVRITTGLARYAANFTPPTAAFPDP